MSEQMLVVATCNIYTYYRRHKWMCKPRSIGRDIRRTWSTYFFKKTVYSFFTILYANLAPKLIVNIYVDANSKRP